MFIAMRSVKPDSNVATGRETPDDSVPAQRLTAPSQQRISRGKARNRQTPTEFGEHSAGHVLRVKVRDLVKKVRVEEISGGERGSLSKQFRKSLAENGLRQSVLPKRFTETRFPL